MSVGQQISYSQIDIQLTSLSIALRNLMQQIANLSLYVNGQDNGLTLLEGIGYDATDAQTALNMISYLNTIAQIYLGTATQATEFNFDQELSQLWAASL